jgi:hypothetical protein
VRGRARQVVVYRENDAGRVAGAHHGPCVGEIQGHGLLAEHMLASRGRVERVRAVQPVDRAYVHRIDIVARYQLVDLSCRERDLMQLRIFGGVLIRNARHSRYLVAEASHRRDDPSRSDIAGTDQSPPQCFH